jgi:enamine deaminase RidA (YjgF/YER057c/UK114 family)
MSTDSVLDKIHELGYELPAPLDLPGVEAKFSFARIIGNRCLLSGHAALKPDGTIADYFGQVGGDVSLEDAIICARLTGLAMLSTLKAELGSLDRINAWGRVFGMVNSAPGFVQQTPVIDGFSDLLIQVFPADIAAHSRSAVGMAALPFNLPVEIEAEVYFN